jgi:putative membrane protein (TIGR04086 family)
MTNVKKSNGKKINKGRRSKNSTPVSPTAEMLKVGWRSVVFSLSAAFIFMLIGAAIAFRGADPVKAIIPISLSALYLSSVLCGFLSSKMASGKTLLNGAFSCFLFIMSILTVSFFLGSKNLVFSSGIKTILFLLIIPSVFAGIMLGNFKVVKKRRRPYRR